jgi:hypothetical protein
MYVPTAFVYADVEEVLLFTFANIVKYRTSEILKIYRNATELARTKKRTFLSKRQPTSLSLPTLRTILPTTIAQKTLSNWNFNYINAGDFLLRSLPATSRISLAPLRSFSLLFTFNHTFKLSRTISWERVILHG